MKTKKKEGQEKDYWYEFFYEECVLCGRWHEEKYRIYDKPKPKEYKDRHHFRQYACGGHF